MKYVDQKEILGLKHNQKHNRGRLVPELDSSGIKGDIEGFYAFRLASQ